MIIRSFDAHIINGIINRPEIRPYVGGSGELDCSALVNDRRNICLVSGDNGAMFAWRGPGVFEGHVFFTERGKTARDTFRAMLTAMFCQFDADLTWGLVPVGNRAARLFMRLVGTESRGVMETPEGDCELFVMERN